MIHPQTIPKHLHNHFHNINKLSPSPPFTFLRPWMAKNWARGPEVAREPAFGGPRKVFRMLRDVARASGPLKFFFKIEEIEKIENWKERGLKNKKRISWFVRKYHFISGSTVKSNTYLLFCHFPRSGWPTWKLHHPFSDGKSISVDLSCFTCPNNTFFSTSALVNNLLGSRATVGHSSSLFSQR